MSITIKTKEIGDTSKKLLKELQELSTAKVSVGHYSSQGNHSSGYSFVDLLNLWANGVIMGEGENKHTVRQDVREQFILDYVRTGELSRNKQVDAALNKWGNTADKGNATTELLNSIGRVLRTEYKTKFNKVKSPYMDATRTPLFETGELSNHTAYKHNKDNKVKV